MNRYERCPICNYELKYYQCLFGGHGHLYLFGEKQIIHLRKLQKYWQTSYEDDEKNRIFNELWMLYGG